MEKPRPKLLSIEKNDGTLFGEVLWKIRNNVKPEDAEVFLNAIPRTPIGGILIELGSSTDKKNAIPNILTTKLMVSCLKPTFTLEIWNLDYLIGKKTKIVWSICSIRKRAVLTLCFNWGHMDTLPEYSMGRTRVLCVENVERQGIKPRLARHKKYALCKERGM